VTNMVLPARENGLYMPLRYFFAEIIKLPCVDEMRFSAQTSRHDVEQITHSGTAADVITAQFHIIFLVNHGDE